MPRFAVLRHDSPRDLHWDFFFETGERLKTWAASFPPAAGDEVTCRELGEHRKVYLDYQGPISGDRGTVIRWDRGEFRIEKQASDCFIFEVEGQWLRGRLTFRRAGEDADDWRLLFEPAMQLANKC